MANAVGIKFDPDQFARFFRLPGFAVSQGDFCVVLDSEHDTERVGYVTCLESRCEKQTLHLAPIKRMATSQEISKWHETCTRRRSALTTARELAQGHDLPMKIKSVDFRNNENEVVFYFTADRRVDFRELVKDLAGHFKARIELWQIGSRKSASEIDGFSCCGQRLCCSSWMNRFPAVSIKHARTQDIHQPPPKLAGFCGRLRCCLRFEYDCYVELLEDAPGVGDKVRLEDGQEGVVIDRNLLIHQALVSISREKSQLYNFEELTVVEARKGKKSALAHAIEAEDEEMGADVDEEVAECDCRKSRGKGNR